MEDLAGINLGKYKLEERVGRGGMSGVYKAYHPNLKRYVAVKVLHQHLSLNSTYLERFKREAAAVAQLRHHNIVQVYDFDFEGFTPYMVMEFIAGKTLQDRLNAEKVFQNGLPLSESAAIFLPLAAAVKYAHSQGVIHQDIKPSNIMFTTDQQVVLADFGIAHVMGNPEHTPTGEFVGTPEFMSPEQFKNTPVDGRSDIYALGILLFLLLTGHSPFRGGNMMEIILKQINDTAPRPSSLKPALSDKVDRVISRTLEKKPEARFSSVDELVQDFLDAAQIEYTVPPGAWDAHDTPADGVKPYVGTAILVAPEIGKPIQGAFQVPRDVPDFVGRQKDLDQLYRVLVQETDQNLVCITGMGGIGKTALATRAAHAFRSDFPDGVLWANIAASDTMAVLDSWTHAIDADFSRLPDLQARAAALRSAFHDKRALFILDDVRTAEDIRLFLPSGTGCAALITTKNLDLPVTLKAHEIYLAEMSNPECHQLFSQIVGDQRVQDEAKTAEAIFELLGNLPLAVDIAARRLASRHRWQLSDLFERLSDERSRLDVLQMSDIAVRSSFAISWDDLDRDLQRTFSLISVFEERPFRTSALAAVADLDRSTASDHLDTLVSYSLLFEQGQKHYRQHTLLDNFAHQQLGDDPVAWRRMSDFYLSYASEYQGEFLALEGEMANITAGMQTAYRLKAWRQTTAYATVLHDFWCARGHFVAARQGYRWSCGAAEALGDQARLADLLCDRGEACIEQNDYDEAEIHLNHARKIYEELPHKPGLGCVMYYLGYIAVERSQFAVAEKLLKESLRIREDLTDEIGVASVLYRLAYISFYQENFDKTEEILKRALAYQDAQSDWRGAIRTLVVLADTQLQKGNTDATLRNSEQALKLCDEYQEQSERATVLEQLSDVHRHKNDFNLARDFAVESIKLLNKMGDRKSQAKLNYKLSIINASMGNFDQALHVGEKSLQLTQEIEDEWGSVYVLCQMGQIYLNSGKDQLAYQTWDEALRISQTFQTHPKTDELSRLIALNDSTS